MNTVQNKWEQFKEMTMPKNAPDIQTQEMKRSFYAGAFSMFNLMIDISDKHTEEKAAKILDDINEETKAFFKSGA